MSIQERAEVLLKRAENDDGLTTEVNETIEALRNLSSQPDDVIGKKLIFKNLSDLREMCSL